MPNAPHFFITSEQVREPYITVTGDDLRHIHTVLRKQPGDLLTLLDGQGREYTVRIMTIEKEKIVTEIVDRRERQPSSPAIVLGQGLPKSDKMDFIFQKATELGVSSIVPLVTERTIVKVKDEAKRAARWQKIAREAAMQSGRPDIPKVETILPFGDYVRTLAPGPQTLLLLPWEEGTVPIKQVLSQTPGVQNIVVLIGPEGGFSQTEADLAKQQGFHLVSLGPNILRTETAAVAVLSMILYETSSK